MKDRKKRLRFMGLLLAVFLLCLGAVLLLAAVVLVAAVIIRLFRHRNGR